MSSSSVKIHQANSQFDKDSISISRPVVVQGGTYFTKIRSTVSNTPYYVQFEPCKTKQGVVSTNKRSYIDLLYNNEDVDILEWFENLQDEIITKIFEQRNEWFQTEMERTDIENNFVNITKSFRGGKYHFIRVGMTTPNERKNKGKACVVFDEYENVISIDDIQETDYIEGILEVQGIRFTSKSFQIELICKQLKVCQKESAFDKCMITRNPISASSTMEEEKVDNGKSVGGGGIDRNVMEVNNEAVKIMKDDKDLQDKTIIQVGSSPNTVYDDVSNVTNDIITSVEMEEKQKDVVPTVSFNNEKEKEEMEKFSENEREVKHIEKDVDNENQKIHDTAYDDSLKPSLNSALVVFKGNEIECSDADDNKEENVGEVENTSPNSKNEKEEEMHVLETSVSLQQEQQEQQEHQEVTEEKEEREGTNTSELSDISSSFESVVPMGETVTTLKDPQEIYYEIYKVAKRKAREHKVKSITHYLEAKNIKNQYLLEDIDESDPDDDINDYYYDSDVTDHSHGQEEYQNEELV
jgi:hypothetical protein